MRLSSSEMAQTPTPARDIGGKIVERLPPPSRSAERVNTTNKMTKPENTDKPPKRKEPKFVPYEPYKAAVKPIIKTESHSKNKHDMSTKSKVETPGKQMMPKNKDNPVEKKRETNVMAVTPILLSKLEKSSKQKSCVESQDRVVTSLQDELAMIKEERECLQQQLQCQIKVNSDLKKLLVASVGEDLEARVQFLTEDKVKLAHDVQHYVQRLMSDHEELEKLSIQCDVWRSKFLASSLIVDELANWKAVLYHRFDDALEAINLLLNEHVKMRDHLQVSHRLISSVHSAFDPLSQRGSSITSPANVIDLATGIRQMSVGLHVSLLGSSTTGPIEKTDIDEPTPGEQRARQVLAGPGLCHPPLDHLATVGTGGSSLRSGIAHRFHPNVRYEFLTMNCCGHCRGDIKLL